jgi:hypothetical protein
MAAFRNLGIGALRLLGADNIAKTTRAIRDDPERAAWVLGITPVELGGSGIVIMAAPRSGRSR